MRSILAAAGVVVMVVGGRADADVDAGRIEARVGEYVDAGLFSGVVLVSRGDTTIYERAYGLADRAFAVTNTPATRFHIASLSKPITAAAVLLLADRGKLSIADHVSKFVPGFPSGDKITIEQLLTHYSGLADASSLPDYDQWARFPQTPQTLVDRLAKLPPRGEPGAAYAYSNSNYHLLALVIEKVAKTSYGEFIAANIFKPAGMPLTGHPADDHTVVEHLAVGYWPRGLAGFDKPTYLDWTSKTGNGSLYSTARDLLAFYKAVSRGKLLKPATVKASWGFDTKDRKVGMFWFHDSVSGHRAVYIGGSSPGYKAHIECFVDDDVCVIALSNLYIASVTPMVNDISSLLWDAAPKLSPIPRPVVRTPAELSKLAGTYTFDASFYAPNVVAKVAVEDGVLTARYGDSALTLLPLADGTYLDRLYWSFIRFEPGKLVYKNGSSEFTAPRSR